MTLWVEHKDCGCGVDGAGTEDSRLRIRYCQAHCPAMAEVVLQGTFDRGQLLPLTTARQRLYRAGWLEAVRWTRDRLQR